MVTRQTTAPTGLVSSVRRLDPGLHQHGGQDVRHVPWRQRKQEAAAAAVHVDGGQIENRPLNENRQRLAGAERRGSADHVAGMLFGDRRFARLDRTAADLARKLLRGYLPVAV